MENTDIIITMHVMIVIIHAKNYLLLVLAHDFVLIQGNNIDQI